MGIIEFISPKWAFIRESWRSAFKMQRNYDAGLYDRRNRNWRAHNESAEFTDRDFRDTIRARSRDLERNSDLMNSQVHPWIRNVIGKGFTLEPNTGDDDLKNAIEKLWKIWCKKDNCDITGSQSFMEMLRMAVRRKRVDGGILFIKCYTEDGIIPFKLQAIEVDELDTTQYAPHNSGCRVVGGIEYNRYNRAVGYWIKQYDIEGFIATKPIYVPRENVIFYFSKNRPSQIREMPELAAGIERIKEVNAYTEAASIKERIAACLSVFIKKVIPTGSGLGRQTPNINAERKSYGEMELTPGLISELNAGDEVQVVNPGNSATNGSEYIKSMIRLISAGQGISYEASSRDLTQANYSSARQAMIEDEITFFSELSKIKDEILDEVYSAFVISAAISGKIKTPPDFWQNTDAYLEHTWHQAPRRWIDPVKESTANAKALETGQKTLNEIWQEGGRDYKSVLDEIKKIQDYAADIGVAINLPYLTGGSSNGERK